MDSLEITDIHPPKSSALPRIEVERIYLERADKRSLIRREGALLILVVGIVSLSWAMPLLQARDLWFSLPCLFNRVTGLPCLTCGMTRSFSLTSHGNLSGAFQMHLLGPPLFLLIVLVGVYLVAALCSGTRLRTRVARSERKIVFVLILGLFVVCWLIKVFVMKGG